MSVADLARFDFARPTSLAAACDLVAARHAKGDPTVLLAGGTDWLVEQEMRAPLAEGAALPLVVDVGRLDELRGITFVGPDRLRIGAAATYLELRRSDVVRTRAPLLARMAADVGALQIQARGTLGGNLATGSPAADGVAALAAFDATVIVRSVRGERAIPFAELQTGYKRSTRAADELVVAIELDLPPLGTPWVWRKVGTRRAQAISKVAFAGILAREEGRVSRVGFGMASVGPVTARLPTARALVFGKRLEELDRASIEAAVGGDVTPIDDVRSTRDYRLHCAKVVVSGWLAELGARG